MPLRYFALAARLGCAKRRGVGVDPPNLITPKSGEPQKGAGTIASRPNVPPAVLPDNREEISGSPGGGKDAAFVAALTLARPKTQANQEAGWRQESRRNFTDAHKTKHAPYRNTPNPAPQNAALHR